MPGIVGFVNNKNFKLDRMTDSMLRANRLIKGDSYTDDTVSISETKLNFSKNRFIQNENLVLFVNGSCFNLDNLNNEFGLNADSLETLLCSAYEKGIIDKVLNKTNGFFSAVIYDKKDSKIYLISDRRGTHFLYYYVKDGVFAFGPEIKSLLALKDIDLTINKDAFDCFMELGYILEDATWFENIKLIKPSSILEYNINDGTFNQHYYWRFTDIPRKEMTFEEAVNGLAELMPKAAVKMYNEEDTIFVPLSGGFDSRMIASSLYEYSHNINQNFVTFGQEGCRDIEISSEIAKKMKQQHRILNITDDDVISDRLDDLWNVDGLISLQHLHGLNLLNKYPKDFMTYFTGVPGGEVYGAVYQPEDIYTDKYPTQDVYKNIYKNQATKLNIEDYYNIPRYYPLVLDNAIRKFSFAALQRTQGFFNVYMPFMENDLLDFLLSVPDEYKKGYKLYYNALKKAFPYWYTKIPFLSAGGFDPANRLQKRIRKLISKFKRFLGMRQQGHFFDYCGYMEHEDVQKRMEEILNQTNSFLENQNFNEIKEYKNKCWEKERFNPDIALKLVSVKLYFDKVSENACTEKLEMASIL